MMLKPFTPSTPMMRKGRLRIRSVWPIGSSSGKSWSATVLPMTHTLASDLTSCSLNMAPCVSGQLRM
jgi:hypothetical protein